MDKLAELEALLYLAGDDGISWQALAELLEINSAELEKLVEQLSEKYQNDSQTAFQVVQINEFYKLTTNSKVSRIVERYFSKDLAKNLSQSALEILAIIAYRQPITRVEIDEIRGVNSSGALQTLIWRGLIKINGKKNAPGHPNLYITTSYFLQYFDFKSLADLPLIEDFEDDESESLNLFGQNEQPDLENEEDKN
ncbi:segregation and condensation protein B [Lactobacillus pasteurii DSM 23907 = CRBIP 24.76]|uniref:Segregation and condensation protein B n=1 Tax=Lactobacillus pasteurii DSM 23907 = CRBIP 24.76 TaxID=1423790 RepID=I7IZW4_9LACO|nr:SMC-Scp complex subunit ScpB [Lactobacillus pasteurii]KRK08621.1 segregation and condensation protein B [Lactobacillus pasteurii DSM 23907 = CRBIP 24.76]TDG76556.1 hypothetical protein C5L33_001315 [Lactobacillus pasteurii]CCI85352.1 Segregation and condensation protein B [Lactobacillus pasteurii DSM 23907 = CRBIP 24.76]